MKMNDQSAIRSYIERRNRQGRKVLSVFLTAGVPEPSVFVDTALDILASGADMLEIGMPFSDPIADGPVIQEASQKALAAGIGIGDVIPLAGRIKKRTSKPVLLMGYANPLVRYGLPAFLAEVREAGVDGLIVPDVPLEEYHAFWPDTVGSVDIVQLTTPTSPAERISRIDELSNGFVYCVSVTGITGVRHSFGQDVLQHLKRTHDLIRRNRMLIGFGISRPEDIRRFAPYCDGVIVGSAVVGKLLSNGPGRTDDVLELVSGLSSACEQNTPSDRTAEIIDR